MVRSLQTPALEAFATLLRFFARNPMLDQVIGARAARNGLSVLREALVGRAVHVAGLHTRASPCLGSQGELQ